MLRNVASQRWRVYAWDTTTGLPETGDAANITGIITIADGTPAATDDTNPSEVDSTGEPGYYDFNLTQAETNGAKLSLSAVSATANIAVIACPPVVYPVPQYHSLLGVESDGDLTKVNTLHGHTPQTGDSFAYLGTNLGALGVNATEAGGTGDHLTALATASGLASLESHGDNTWSTATGFSTLDAAGVRTAVGLASANLDTQLGAIAGYIDTEVGAIVSALSTAQADLNIITGADGVTLATAQGNYAPAKAGDEMDLVDAPNPTAVGVIQDGLSTLTAEQVNAEVDTAISDAALATAEELAKVPKKDEALTFTRDGAGVDSVSVTITDAE